MPETERTEVRNKRASGKTARTETAGNDKAGIKISEIF